MELLCYFKKMGICWLRAEMDQKHSGKQINQDCVNAPFWAVPNLNVIILNVDSNKYIERYSNYYFYVHNSFCQNVNDD